VRLTAPSRAPLATAPPPPPKPAVAFFNVGELAVDALIATLGLRLAARLGSPDLLAVVGNDAFDHEGAAGQLATALELYSAGPGARWGASRELSIDGAELLLRRGLSLNANLSTAGPQPKTKP
jgi:hypothetical protein